METSADGQVPYGGPQPGNQEVTSWLRDLFGMSFYIYEYHRNGLQLFHDISCSKCLTIYESK